MEKDIEEYGKDHIEWKNNYIPFKPPYIEKKYIEWLETQEGTIAIRNIIKTKNI